MFLTVARRHLLLGTGQIIHSQPLPLRGTHNRLAYYLLVTHALSSVSSRHASGWSLLDWRLAAGVLGTADHRAKYGVHRIGTTLRERPSREVLLTDIPTLPPHKLASNLKILIDITGNRLQAFAALGPLITQASTSVSRPQRLQISPRHRTVFRVLTRWFPLQRLDEYVVGPLGKGLLGVDP